MRLRTLLALCFMASAAFCCMTAEANSKSDTVIVCPASASPLQQYAAKEIRRYAYLRTGQLLRIAGEASDMSDAIVVARENVSAPLQATFKELKAEEYWLKTIPCPDGRTALLVTGGSDVAMLYAAYRFAEVLGVRFYLHGDVIPDAPIPLAVLSLDERRAPLFELRGIQPFHDFAEGPDWWNADDYKAILCQLPKLGMNFFGLHTYPENRPAAEPTVWIGTEDNIAPDGRVHFAYPAIYYNTLLNVNWGYAPKATADYALGAGAMYDRNDYGSDIMRGLGPMPQSPRDCNEVFNRAGAMLHDAFTLAHSLGIKTCVGTETALVVPQRIRERMAVKNTSFEVLGGKLANYNEAIANTEDDALYQNVRYDVDGYRFPLPNGSYNVTLKFCEVAYDRSGARVFDVCIQKRRVMEALDIFTKAGKNVALDCTFSGVQVTDGVLDISFPRRTEFPSVAAIAIEGATANVKINCGGTAYKDYLPDDGTAQIDNESVRKLYEGMFTRIARTYPVDYYWFWTPENWTWEGVKQEVVDATITDIQTAIAAAKNVAAPFQLATCGWVLGPQTDRALFDKVLPKEMPVSCINRKVGMEPVDRGFSNVADRPKWAIPWLEDDPAMNSIQLWAGRMRRDAADALEYGCTGLMGIHWRTRILSPNVSALAKAAWDQAGWGKKDAPGASEFRPVDDFYRDWALSEFGPEAAEEAAALFAKIDCRLPRPSDWIGGPGGYQPDKRSWNEVSKEYAFVDELAALRSRISGKGNAERFDYWLSNFEFLRAMGKVRCIWAEFDVAMEKAKAGDTPENKKRVARETALPLRKTLIAAVSEAYCRLLATVNTAGEMGSVTNLEQHTLPGLVEKPGAELSSMLGEALPPDAELPREYTGRARVFVSSVRNSVQTGEPLSVNLVVLGEETPRRVSLRWRTMGEGGFREVPMRHVARGIYAATVESLDKDVEYYCEAEVGRHRLVWPAMAPNLNQTVIVGLPN